MPRWIPLAPMEEEKEIFKRERKKYIYTKAGTHKQIKAS